MNEKTYLCDFCWAVDQPFYHVWLLLSSPPPPLLLLSSSSSSPLPFDTPNFSYWQAGYSIVHRQLCLSVEARLSICTGQRPPRVERPSVCRDSHRWEGSSRSSAPACGLYAALSLLESTLFVEVWPIQGGLLWNFLPRINVILINMNGIHNTKRSSGYNNIITAYHPMQVTFIVLAQNRGRLMTTNCWAVDWPF